MDSVFRSEILKVFELRRFYPTWSVRPDRKGLNIEGGRFEIASDDLTLYAIGSTTAIATTGVFDPQPTGQNPTLTASLGAGSYYIKDTFVVPDGYRGAFDVFASVAPAVSSAPEPATWALMVFGIGAAGGMLRLRRRHSALACLAA